MTDELARFTTLQVGGPAWRVVEATTRDELIAAALEAWGTGDEWLVLGGGSNVVIADEGFEGTVVRVLTRGIERRAPVDGPGQQRIRVEAGEPWDAVVAYAVENGLAGIEALSGIPGSAGAAPIQNIGAYGQELGETLVAVDFLDFDSGEVARLTAAELELDYRTSALKQGRRGVVLSVELLLASDESLSLPIAYDQLARALGVAEGDRAPLVAVR